VSSGFRHGGSAGTRCEFGGNPSHIHAVFEKFEIPDMLAASLVVMFVFLKTRSYIWSIFLVVCCLIHVLSNQHLQQRSRHSWALKKYTKLMFFTVSASKHYTQHYKSLYSVFHQFKPKFDSDMLFIQVCDTLVANEQFVMNGLYASNCSNCYLTWYWRV